MKSELRGVFGVLLLGAGLSMCSALRSEDAKSEADTIAAEDAAAAKLDPEIRSPLNGMVFEGLFSLQSADQTGDAEILGTFKTADNIYLVKAATPEMKKQLPLYNNKKASVFGKIRNDGKYIIVIKINPVIDPPPNLRKPKGF